MSRKLALACLSFLLLACAATPLLGQQQRERYPVAAAGWCVAHSGKKAEPEPSADQVAAPSTTKKGIGCDIGVAASLISWRRAFLGAALGSKSLGAFLGWTAFRPERGPVLAFGVGPVAPYDSDGIYLGDLGLSVGATLTFGKRGGDE